MNNENQYKVKLTYFKPTGKYYTEGYYTTTKVWMHEISDEVKEMQQNNTLPGIMGNNWIIHIEVEESHPNAYPCLCLLNNEYN